MSDDTPVTICKLADLGNGDSRGVTLEQAGRSHDIFVVVHDGRVFAYLNRCPHTGAPLDWVPDRFLSLDGMHIQCANHAALFRIEDGACVAGPCNGTGLAALPVEINDGTVRLHPGFSLPVPRQV
jgi:nitrite reductase/ring-hydroxylating ferredoxin subunit